jgi:protocatechuate 3,4-dioxygenase beta subunit
MRRKLPNVSKSNTLSRKLAVFCALLVLTSLSYGAAAQPTGAAEAAVDLLPADLNALERFDASGEVVDTEGNPVSGAEVYAYFRQTRIGVLDRFVGKTVTDKRGKFKFEKTLVWPAAVPGDDDYTRCYNFIAKSADLGIDFEIVREGDPTEDITITLSGVESYQVVTQDPEGNPIPGANVYLTSGQHREEVQEDYERPYRYLLINQDVGVSSGMTDENGRVELMGTPEAAFAIRKEGYTRGYGDETVTLFPAARVSGTVTYEDGTPAAGVSVVYVYHGAGLHYDQATLTDGEGRYVFDDAPGAGFYYSFMSEAAQENEKRQGGYSQLRVVDLRPDSKYMAKSVTFDLETGGQLTKDLALEPGCVLSGTVSDLVTGEPVPNMVMRLLIETGRRGLDTKDANADENGEFSVIVATGDSVRLTFEESRRDGNYMIDEEWRRQSGNYYAYQGTVTEDITDMKVKVKLLSARRVTGRVLDDQGQGVKDAMVYVHSDLPAVKTDDSGSFTLKTVPKGDGVELFAISEDETLAALVRLGEGDTEATIALEPTKDYDGQVLNTEGLPAGKLVFYLDLYLNARAHYRVRQEPEADADGKFAVENLCPEATYYAWWSSDHEDNRDYSYGNATIELAKVDPGEPITFEAKQFLNALMGRVLNEKGEPIEGAQVQVTSWDMVPQDARNVEIKSDNNGEFVVERLAPGEVVLRISAQGYKARSTTSSSDNIEFETALQPVSEGTVYRITVADDEGNPVADAPLALSLKLYQEGKESGHSDNAITDADGKAEFVFKSASEKVSGRGFIGCDLEGYDVAYRGVQVNEDIDSKLVLHKGPEHWSGQVADQENKPIAGAEVKVVGMRQGKDWRTHASFEDQLEFTYVTDEDGRFELSRFSKKDSVSLQLSAEGRARQNAWLDAAQETQNRFVLAPGGAVSGKVVIKKTGELLALSGLTVGIVSADHEYRQCDIPGDGTFSCDGLSAGQYALNYYPKGPDAKKYLALEQSAFTVAAGETAEVVVEVEEGTAVSGKLLDAATGARPKGYAAVLAYNAEGRPVGPSAVVEDDGSWMLYVLEGVHEIAYRLEGMQQPEKVKSITVEKGQAVEEIVIEMNTEAD